jgi:hypothetical protein
MTKEAIIQDVHSKYPGKLTFRVIITCVMAASGGLIFGYDHGVSGNSFIHSHHFFMLKFTFFFVSCLYLFDLKMGYDIFVWLLISLNLI